MKNQTQEARRKQQTLPFPSCCNKVPAEDTYILKAKLELPKDELQSLLYYLTSELSARRLLRLECTRR